MEVFQDPRGRVEVAFPYLMGRRLAGLFGRRANDGVVVMRKLVAGILPIDGGGEGTDVVGLSDPPGMVVGLACQDAEVTKSKVVFMLSGMFHNRRLEGAASLTCRRKMFFATFLYCTL